MLHSFVVPAYGHSPFLEACLASLAAQTVPSQVVVSTSTPFPGLEALAARHGARVVVHGPNAGIGRDWNRALAAAVTPWVTLAHQDDVYLPDFAERTLALAMSAPDVVMVQTGYAELLGDGRVRRASPMLLIKRGLLELGFLGRSLIRAPAARQRMLRFGCPVPCPSVTLRTDGAPIQFREDLKVNLDWEAWLRLSKGAGAFAYSRRVAMLHRIHAGSETSEGVRGGARAREDRMMFESVWPKPVARWLARCYAWSYAAGDA